MRTWDTRYVDVEPYKPTILSSSDAVRLIALNLPAGEDLDEHKVHERAFVLIVDGEVEVEGPNGDTEKGGPGFLAEFEPGEEHEVRANSDARLLLFLAPWPGAGHPGAMSLEDKQNVRERARDRADS
jgi:quercetin dioxygenase-like cupin family protein